MKKTIKIILPIVIFYFIFRTIFSDWQTTSGYLFSIKIGSLFLAFIIMLIIHIENAYCWSIIIKTLQPKIKLVEAMPIWIVSNTSRYIPGTVWQYLGRIELASKSLDIKKSIVGLSLIYEIFLSLASGSILSLFVVIYNPAVPNWMIIPGLLAVVIFLQPKVISIVINIIIRVLRKRFKNLNIEHNFSAIYKTLPWFILGFFLNGLAFIFLSNSLGASFGLQDVILLSSFYAFSWLIGFVTLVAPGGIGIMEGSMTIMLSTIMPATQAGIIALMYRFFLTLAEVSVFAYSLYKIRK